MAIRVQRLPHTRDFQRHPRLDLALLIGGLVAVALLAALIARGLNDQPVQGPRQQSFFDQQQYSLVGADGGGTVASHGNK